MRYQAHDVLQEHLRYSLPNFDLEMDDDDDDDDDVDTHMQEL